MNETDLALFENYKIRRHFDAENESWYFSVIDVVGALTDSVNPRDYWFKVKVRVKSDDGFELSTICRQFKMKSPDGKMRLTDTANVQGLLRIIQSIPSPKAEPFKQWLAKVGYERMRDMAPKNKFTKEEMVEAALRVVQAKGIGCLTAKAIADELGTSTRPIFTYFGSMDEVKQAVYAAAVRVYDSYTKALQRECQKGGRRKRRCSVLHG